jgi:dienelactone hydrolase
MSIDTNPRLSIGRIVRLAGLGIVTFLLGFFLRGIMIKSQSTFQLLSPLSNLEVEKKPENIYLPYSFANLRTLQLTPGPITLHSLLETTPSYNSYLISWEIPDLINKKNLKVSGQMNIPTGKGPFPVIVMNRGYVEKEQYSTGIGTKPGAAALAKNGYVTIAPDFLGYGQSDPESDDILLARFSRPVVVLQLLRNLGELHIQLDPSGNPNGNGAAPSFDQTMTNQVIDTTRIGMWGHSNGGQIALSVLEITSRTLPTTLWAPVSVPFPYSVLYFMNDLADGGDYLRKQLSYFEYELENDPRDFSIMTEPSRILAPVQIHQGGTDDAVPLVWSEALTEKLKAATVSATLYTYPQANHQMVPDWDTVVQRDLQFFAKYLKR